jgi:hypothetical protein
MRTPAWCRKRSAEIGPAVAELVAELLGVNALHRLRQAQGVVALADHHPAPRVNAACRLALSVGDPSYRTVKGILAAGTENEAHTEAGAALTTPAHLHGPAQLLGGTQKVAS